MLLRLRTREWRTPNPIPHDICIRPDAEVYNQPTNLRDLFNLSMFTALICYISLFVDRIRRVSLATFRGICFQGGSLLFALLPSVYIFPWRLHRSVAFSAPFATLL